MCRKAALRNQNEQAQRVMTWWKEVPSTERATLRIFRKCCLFQNQIRVTMSRAAYKDKFFLLSRKLNSGFPDSVYTYYLCLFGGLLG